MILFKQHKKIGGQIDVNILDYMVLMLFNFLTKICYI